MSEQELDEIKKKVRAFRHYAKIADQDISESPIPDLEALIAEIERLKVYGIGFLKQMYDEREVYVERLEERLRVALTHEYYGCHPTMTSDSRKQYVDAEMDKLK